MNEEKYFIHLEPNAVWLACEYYVWTGFRFSVDSNYAVALVLHCYACWLAEKIWRHFLNQSSKTKTNWDLLECILPRLAPATCICLEFWLVYMIDCDMFCDWPE